MCKNCKNCNGFIPKSKKTPYNPFDYITGNRIGVCNEMESVTPLFDVVEDCDMWVTKTDE